MKQYRKKPVVIDAVQWDGSESEAARIVGIVPNSWVGGDFQPGDPLNIQIQTLEGRMTASKGDYIIRGVKGEYYPCKPDIFAVTYEPA